MPGNRGRRAGRREAASLPDARTDCSAGRIGIAAGLVPPRQGGPSPRWRSVGDGRLGGGCLRPASTATCWPDRLGDPAGHCGVLVFLAPAGRIFDPEHAELAQLLLGAVLGGAGERPAAARDGRPARGRRGRQAVAADAAGTQDPGRHDRRRRVGPPRRDGARGIGRPLRRARADLRRDGHRQGIGRPGDPQPLARGTAARSIASTAGRFRRN